MEIFNAIVDGMNLNVYYILKSWYTKFGCLYSVAIIIKMVSLSLSPSREINAGHAANTIKDYEIQQKYKKDPKKMAENDGYTGTQCQPAAGCLPLLIQIIYCLFRSYFFPYVNTVMPALFGFRTQRYDPQYIFQFC